MTTETTIARPWNKYITYSAALGGSYGICAGALKPTGKFVNLHPRRQGGHCAPGGPHVVVEIMPGTSKADVKAMLSAIQKAIDEHGGWEHQHRPDHVELTDDIPF